MAVNTLQVVSDDELVGVVARQAGYISFTYEPTWQRRSGATPLSVSMPLDVDHHDHDTVQPWLWGLLPDNDRVLQRWAREFHTTATHPLGLLSGVGRDLPGQFQMLSKSPKGAALSSGVDWLTDAAVAELLADVRKDQTAWLGAGAARGRWSLAGAQAKIALRLEGDRWGRPYGRSATTHILKPAISDLDDHDINEHLCLRAAFLAGLRAAPSRIVRFGDERAICLERYDRIITDDSVVRVHQEDFCQALTIHPENKYEADGGPGASQIAGLLMRTMPAAVSAEARMQFLEALALNWLIGGTDAHAKNYALLLNGNAVRMAPLYDVASLLPYDGVYADKLKLSMRVGGKYMASRVTAADWSKAAAQLDVEPSAALQRVTDLAGRLPDAFAQAAADVEVASLGSPLPNKLRDLVTTRCEAFGARLR